jgi:hypothetical protein
MRFIEEKYAFVRARTPFVHNFIGITYSSCTAQRLEAGELLAALHPYSTMCLSAFIRTPLDPLVHFEPRHGRKPDHACDTELCDGG